MAAVSSGVVDRPARRAARVRFTAAHSGLRDAAFRIRPLSDQGLKTKPSGGSRPMDRRMRRRRGWGRLSLAAVLGMALLIGGAVVAYAKGGTAKPPAGAGAPLVSPPPPRPRVTPPPAPTPPPARA